MTIIVVWFVQKTQLSSEMLHLLRRFPSVTSGCPGAVQPRWASGLPHDELHYVQGQSPEPKMREYFYYVDHEGFLFLDDARMKNFTSCFKDRPFLRFFFQRLRRNRTDRYASRFPYVSLCGRERNFVRCNDVPIVFTHVLTADNGGSQAERLSYAHAGDMLSVAFEPHRLFMSPRTGRVYHPADDRHGRIGLVRSKLAIEFSQHFEYDESSATDGDLLESPVRFRWNGISHPLQDDWIASSADGRAMLKRTTFPT